MVRLFFLATQCNFVPLFLLNANVGALEGVNVTGAFGWAIFDNFEWFSGSRVKFGLQYLDTTTLERTPKASMFQFLDWFSLHSGGGNSAGGNGSSIPNARLLKRG